MGLSEDVGDIHVVSGRAKLFQLLIGKNVDRDQVDLGVTVLASLGSRHINDLARAALNNDVSTLAEGRALHGERQRGAGAALIEVMVMLQRDTSQQQMHTSRGCDGGGRSNGQGRGM